MWESTTTTSAEAETSLQRSRGHSHDSLDSEVTEVPTDRTCWQFRFVVLWENVYREVYTLPTTVHYKNLLQKEHAATRKCPLCLPVSSDDEA